MGSYYELQNTPSKPVSLADAKSFLRVDFTKDDDVITDLIDSAVNWGEAYTQRDFSQKDWIAYFDDTCETPNQPKEYLKLERSPLISVDSYEVSKDNTYSASTDFILKNRAGFSLLLLTASTVLDTLSAYTYKVTFSSGYTTLPSAIKQAILEHVSFLYENRADSPSEPPMQVKNMYAPYKLVIGYA